MFTAEFCSEDIVLAAGNAVTMYDISDAKASAAKPAQMTRRERLYS